MDYFASDDIAQIGTPAGPGLVGAIRISGPNAFAILLRTTRGLEGDLGRPPVRSTRECRFLLPLAGPGRTGERRAYSCPARVFLMPRPASYTREDVAELHLPGAPTILDAAMDALAAAGARPAGPGEFTFRAFRNGRISLNQAEAVEAVIRAGTDAQRRSALSRLGDRDLLRVREWRDSLMDMAAAVEAALDFSEEELEGDVIAGLADLADRLATSCRDIARDSSGVTGGLPHVALVGLTNAGKSSLMNCLLGEEAVLVSPEVATTRDSVRRETVWHGVRLILSDNPGYVAVGSDRAAARAFRSLGGEDVTCWVIDASRPLSGEDGAFAAGLPASAIAIRTKCDLAAAWNAGDLSGLARRHGVHLTRILDTSVAGGQGLEELRSCLADAAGSATAAGTWSRRELLEMSRAAESCQAAAAELGGAGRLELAAEDLRRGVAAFSRMLGEGYAEETLERIFSRFCIGK